MVFHRRRAHPEKKRENSENIFPPTLYLGMSGTHTVFVATY